MRIILLNHRTKSFEIYYFFSFSEGEETVSVFDIIDYFGEQLRSGIFTVNEVSIFSFSQMKTITYISIEISVYMTCKGFIPVEILYFKFSY